jgi:hypothetical protein
MDCRLFHLAVKQTCSELLWKEKWTDAFHAMLGYSIARVFNHDNSCGQGHAAVIIVNVLSYTPIQRIFASHNNTRPLSVKGRVKMFYRTGGENAVHKWVPATVMPKYFHHRHGIRLNVVKITHEHKTLCENFFSLQSNRSRIQNLKPFIRIQY